MIHLSPSVWAFSRLMHHTPLRVEYAPLTVSRRASLSRPARVGAWREANAEGGTEKLLP